LIALWVMPPWLEYLVFFGFWILIFACPAIVFGWMIWWFKLTPKNVRSLRQALKKKLPPIFVGWDDGRMTIHAPTEILPEGAIKTGDLTFTLPRASPTDTPKIKEVLQKRFFMDGCPVWIGYAGKAVAANVKTLAVLEHGDKFNPKHNPTFFPVDARTLKTTMPHAWDQMLITALETKADLSGMLKGKKYFGNFVKQWMPLMVILALVIAIIVLAAILL